jgi:hypothetical protein
MIANENICATYGLTRNLHIIEAFGSKAALTTVTSLLNSDSNLSIFTYNQSTALRT